LHVKSFKCFFLHIAVGASGATHWPTEDDFFYVKKKYANNKLREKTFT